MPGIILIFIALLIGAISGVFRRIPNKMITVGEIVSIERERDLGAGGSVYTANVEYYVSGIPYTIKSSFRSSTFRTGQKLGVAYNKGAPEYAFVRPEATTYILMAGFVVAGLVVCYRSFFK